MAERANSDSGLRAEAAALGFDLTDDQVQWAEVLLARQPVTFIGSRRFGREYALRAAVAIDEARKAMPDA